MASMFDFYFYLISTIKQFLVVDILTVFCVYLFIYWRKKYLYEVYICISNNYVNVESPFTDKFA